MNEESHQAAGTSELRLNVNHSHDSRFTVVSLFAGCGGLDLGFIGGFELKGERFLGLPFTIVKAYDNDPKCVETYKLNIGRQIVQEDLKRLTAREMPYADVLLGGFPCQDFSSCGPKNGLNSDRGQLYRVFVRYMEYHHPLVVIAENVPYLGKMEKGAVLRRILGDLESVGYRFAVWSLSAPDYGVPQRRKRLFITGVRDDLPGFPECPPVTHASSHRSIEWAIGDLEDVTDGTVVPNQDQYFRATKAKRGNGQGDEKSRAGEPGYTVRANAKSRVQFHYKLPRRLTVRECARLQTFPDTFVFPHSATTNMLQIGNAVPPLLAYRVAESIARYLSIAGVRPGS